MTTIENIEKFLSMDQFQKLKYQLNPVCEKHCDQSLLCCRGISTVCPIQVYIEHLRNHTRLYNKPSGEINSSPVKEALYSDMLKKDLSMPQYSRIKAKLRKISLTADNITRTGFSVKLALTIREIRNLMEELHEFDSMIRDIDSMILRGYFYECLDHLTKKCRTFEEDLRWAEAERACYDRQT